MKCIDFYFPSGSKPYGQQVASELILDFLSEEPICSRRFSRILSPRVITKSAARNVRRLSAAQRRAGHPLARSISACTKVWG